MFPAIKRMGLTARTGVRYIASLSVKYKLTFSKYSRAKTLPELLHNHHLKTKSVDLSGKISQTTTRRY